MSLDLSKVATKLLKKLASRGHVRLSRITGEITNNITGVKSGGTTEIIPLNAAVIDTKSFLDDETRLAYGDRVVLADNLITPLMTDVVLIPDASGADIEYRMVDVSGFNHAGIQQIWQFICRA